MKKYLNIMYAPDASNGGGQQASVQSAVLQSQLGPETRRKLSTVTYSQSGQAQVDIPRDTVIKRMNLQFSAAVNVVYTGAQAVLSPLGLFAKIVPQCTINADGSRNIKVLDLYIMRCMNALVYDGFGRRAYATGAGLIASTRLPTQEWLAGPVNFGVTGADVVVNESLDIDFECYLAYETGRTVTLLYTKNLSTCTLGFQFASLSQANQDGNATTGLTFANADITITPTIIENRNADVSNGAFDFVETVIRKQFSQQVSQFAVDLNTGNRLVGLALLAQNGDTAKSLADFVITDLNLVVNGSTSIMATRFKDVMNDNKGRYGLSEDAYSAGQHALQGFAHLNLLMNGDIRTGLDTRLANGTSQVQLLVSSASSAGVDAATYTNPVQLSVMQQQLIPVPVKA